MVLFSSLSRLALLNLKRVCYCLFNESNANPALVAIKKFKESAEEDQIVKKTTKREVKMLSVLKDRSVVKMIEAFKR